MRDTELYHYGRKGMKWYQHIYGEEDSRAKYSSSAKQEHGAVTTLEIALAISALGGAYNIGRSAIRKSISKKEKLASKVDKRTGLLLKTRAMTQKEDAIRTNTKYGYLSVKSYKKNCTNCTMTYDLRRRGYEVNSKGMTQGRTTDETLNYFKKKPEVTRVDRGRDAFGRKYVNNAYQSFQKYPNNSRGNLLVSWTLGGGHSVAWEKDSSGQLTIIDGQNGKIYKTESQIKRLLSNTFVTETYRMDNLQYDWDKIKEEVVE